jgi:putative tryptophan/tyrosine transport system substrate-binding protein
MRRREFIGFLGGATAWPIAARAQQAAMPMIGLLNGVSNESYANRISAIRQGLQEVGYIEGRNVLIEYRSADGQYDRLSAMAAELTRLPVAVIVAIGGTPSARAAKTATSTIPIVFAVGSDVVELGLVKSLNRPEGNLTGMSLQNAVLTPKRLELLCKLVPGTGSIGALLNPAAANSR